MGISLHSFIVMKGKKKKKDDLWGGMYGLKGVLWLDLQGLFRRHCVLWSDHRYWSSAMAMAWLTS